MSNHSPLSAPWGAAAQWIKAARIPRAVLAALAALAAALALLALAWSAGGRAPWSAAAAVEVVEGQPLRVEHGGALGPRQPSPAAGDSSPGGRAVVREHSYDFGVLRPNEAVQHDFLILNAGDTPLTIRGAYTTCGCTTALISAQVIPPGKAARATLIFDAGYHNVRGQTVRRGLIIETSDPDQAQVELWVQASVR